MNINSVDVIRKSTRYFENEKRKERRNIDNDTRRGFTDINDKDVDVSDIAVNLKKKGTVTVRDLWLLKNSLLTEKSNISVVMGSQGALRGLVREISGPDIKRQIEAAGCICNLALGDAKSCGVLAKAAGTYLVTCLDSLSLELAVTSTWAIGNLASSGLKATEILLAQGALAKLTNILHNNNDDMMEAALYAINHFIDQLKDILSEEYVRRLLAALQNSKLPSKWQTLFLLSCHKDYLTNDVTSIVESCLLVTKDCYSHVTCENTECSHVYALRILANTCNERNSGVLWNYFVENECLDVFRYYLSMGKVLEGSCLWFLGNLSKYGLRCDVVNMLNEFKKR